MAFFSALWERLAFALLQRSTQPLIPAETQRCVQPALRMPVAALLLILSTAAALKPALAPPLQSNGLHGLPLLPSGEHLTLEAPGWTRGIGTGGRVWPASAALCRYLARTGAVRGKAVLELGCGTGATGLTCAAALNASSVLLTEGGSEGLLQLARRNVEACVEIKQ